MPLSGSRQPVLPASWSDVLEQIQQCLDRAIAVAVEREQSLQAIPSDAAAEEGTLDSSLRERLGSLEARVQQAEQSAAEAEAVLQSGTEAARRWLESAGAIRRRLADWTGSQV